MNGSPAGPEALQLLRRTNMPAPVSKFCSLDLLSIFLWLLFLPQKVPVNFPIHLPGLLSLKSYKGVVWPGESTQEKQSHSTNLSGTPHCPSSTTRPDPRGIPQSCHSTNQTKPTWGSMVFRPINQSKFEWNSTHQLYCGAVVNNCDLCVHLSKDTWRCQHATTRPLDNIWLAGDQWRIRFKD